MQCMGKIGELGFTACTNRPRHIKTKFITKQVAHKKCLSYTPSSIYGYDFRLTGAEVISQPSDLILSSYYFFHNTYSLGDAKIQRICVYSKYSLAKSAKFNTIWLKNSLFYSQIDENTCDLADFHSCGLYVIHHCHRIL